MATPTPDFYTAAAGELVVAGRQPVNHALAGDATAAASVVGGLTHGVPLSGAAQAVATATGTLPVAAGSQVTTLTLHASQTGDYPYIAAIFPLEGTVPGHLVSPDDANLRSSVLSVWADGSAKVVTLAGSAGVTAGGTKTVRLLTGTKVGTDLTAARIQSVFNGQAGVVCDFGAHGVGTLAGAAFGSPEFLWWTNPTSICARYRVPIGSSWLEAVIDVHAFASPNDRALVEVVIENGKLNPATAHPSNGATYPPTYAYTGATVTVNGSVIATVNSAHTYDTAYDHRPFSAWACSTWVGGDPGIEVTHDPAYLQSHPLLFKAAVPSSVDLQALYAGSTYTPWGGGLNRASQAGTGGHDSIGPLSKWEAQYVQSGSRYARRAVLASGTALLHSNVSYRNVTTGLPLSAADIAGKTIATGSGSTAFPRTDFPFADYTANYHWDYAHQPAAGLMPFLCRPSPMFLEVAQKVATYNALGNNAGDGLLGEFFAWRGKAWGLRNIAHAAFLTPDAQTAWKAAVKANISANATFFTLWSTNQYATLNVTWEDTPYYVSDASGVGVQQSVWMSHFFIPEIHKAHRAKVVSGAAQTTLGTFADWVAMQPVRWINEQAASGSWRYIGYRTVIGSGTAGSPAQMLQAADWGTQRAYAQPTPPASVSGTWMTGDGDGAPYANANWQPDSIGGFIYVEPFWTSLVAAYERGVSGAITAWQTVESNITNLSAWLSGGGGDPRHISFPRNYGWGSGAETGTAPTVGNGWLWTPGKDGAGLVNAASWALVPLNTWVQVSGSRLDSLDSVVKAAIPGWDDYGNSDWNGVTNAWNGMAVDTSEQGNERAWLACSGGHADSSNDGIYRFDLRKMVWAIQRLPMDTQYWAQSYKDGIPFGTTTNYGPAASYYGADQANALGVYADEFFDGAYPNDPLRSPRTPTARHTYGSLVFARSLGGAGKILMGCRRYWEYDLATDTWALPKFPFGNQVGYNGNGELGYAGENMQAWWHEAGQRYYLCATQNYGYGYTWSCAPGGVSWQNNGWYPTGGYASMYTAQEFLDDNKIWTLLYDNSNNAQGKPATMRETTVSPYAVVDHAVTLGASFAGRTFATASYWDGGGMTYVADQGRWLCNILTQQDGDIFAWLDATTWTLEVASIGGVSGGPYLLENKIKYYPTLKAVLWVHTGTSNVRIMRTG